MAHEMSESIEQDGEHLNVSGVTGEVLERGFETQEQAVLAAKLRSRTHGNPMGPLASGVPGWGPEAQPPFTMDDLEAAPPDFWQQLDDAFQRGDLTPDDYVGLQRQRVYDWENPLLTAQREDAERAQAATMLQAQREDAAARETTQAQLLQAQAEGAQQTVPVGQLGHITFPAEGAPEAHLTIQRTGAPAPPVTPRTTSQIISEKLGQIGLKGVRPMEPAVSIVDAMYAGDPNRAKNPVYITARRLAMFTDLGLNAINVAGTGVGDLANLVFAPITLGLIEAGFSEEDVAKFVEATRLVPELVAGFELGLPSGTALGRLGIVGNLTGATKEVKSLVREVGALGKQLRVSPAVLADTKVVDEAGRPKRVYHGTARTFESFDPEKVDKHALYGPGFYHTEDPTVAGGTGTSRQSLGYATPSPTLESERVAAEQVIETLRHEADLIRTDPAGAAARFRDPAQRLRDIEGSIRYAEGTLRRLETVSPQVRPAYLDIKNPFDIEAEAATVGDQVATLLKLADAADSVRAGRTAIEMRQNADFIGGGTQGGSYRPNVQMTDPPWPPSHDGLTKEKWGQWLYDELVRTSGGKAEANQILQAAGYDGITHSGGQIAGTKPHRVWIAFHPEQVVSPFEIEATTPLSRHLMNQFGGVSLGRGPKVAPDARDIKALFEEGQKAGGALWYHGFGNTLRKLYGDQVANKAAHVIAALSPLRPAAAFSETGKYIENSNLEMFAQVWDAYQRGGEKLVARLSGPGRKIGMMKSQKVNVLRALRGEQIGGDDALKIQNFAQALLGDTKAVVLDSWMKKIFYPDHYLKAWVKELDADGEPLLDANGKTVFKRDSAGNKIPDIDPKTGKQRMEFVGSFSPAQYRATADIIRKFAADHGVEPSDVQAALWVAKKLRDEGEAAMLGSQPFKDTLRQVFEHRGYDLSVFDDAGKKEIGLMFALAHAALGGAVGGAQGETSEEKFRNALIGAGLGAVISPALLKAGAAGVDLLRSKVSPGLADPAITATRDAGQRPPVGPAVLPHTPQTLARQYADAVVTARRGGPRTHPQVQQEAQALIDQGLVSMETVRAITPGTTLDDAHAVAVVKTLADSGIRMKALAQRALQTGDPADVQAVMQQLYLHAQVDPARIGVVTETGRTLSAMNEPTSGMNRFLVQFEELLRDQTAGVDPQAVVRSIADFKDPDQLAILARQATKPGFWDAFKEYYVNGLLWGPKTWMANMIGNTATTAWAIPERQLASWMGAFHSGDGVVQGEAFAMMQGMFGSILDAWRLAKEGFKAGESQFQTAAEQAAGQTRTSANKLELTHPRAISSETWNLTGLPGAAVDFLGNIVRFPGRVLAGTDDFFKVINYRGELRAQALREATQEVAGRGLTGKAYADAVNRRMLQILADPPLSVKRAADNFALYQTFTTELGETGQLIQRLAQTPGGKVVLPFVRTPINIAKYATDRTPLGLFKKSIWSDLTGKDLAKRDLALAKLSLGSMTMGIASYFAYEGMITGAGPADPKLRAQLQAQGWQPYSIKIGGKYYSYNRTEPIGMLLGLAANYTDAAVNAEGEDWDLQSGAELATDLAAATTKMLASRTFVKGLAETMAFIADPERAGDIRSSSFLMSLVPLSGAVRQVEQIVNPELAEASTVMDRVLSQIPGFSKSVPPRRDLWGNPIFMTGVYGPIAVSSLKDDPVLKEIVAVKANIADIPRKVEMNIGLTAQERDEWAVKRGTMELDGETLKQSLTSLIKSGDYKEYSEERKAWEIELRVKQYTQAALADLKEKYPVIQDSVDAARQKKGEQMEAPATQRPSTPLLRSLTR